MSTKYEDIAERLGIKSSMVYKITRGHRYPSFSTMLQIEKELDWSLNEQITARRNRVYHSRFLEILSAKDHA